MGVEGRMESVSWSIQVGHGDPVFEPSTTQESQNFQLLDRELKVGD